MKICWLTLEMVGVGAGAKYCDEEPVANPVEENCPVNWAPASVIPMAGPEV